MWGAFGGFLGRWGGGVGGEGRAGDESEEQDGFHVADLNAGLVWEYQVVGAISETRRRAEICVTDTRFYRLIMPVCRPTVGWHPRLRLCQCYALVEVIWEA